MVFGMLILHHLDLPRAAAEVHRVLKPGGRAIFTEPIRNSKLIGAIRGLIPYRQPDVSPFERPLRFDELDAFAARFGSWTHRVFDLPFVRLLRVCGASEWWQSRAYALNGRMLRRWPQLRHFASVMVFEVHKEPQSRLRNATETLSAGIVSAHRSVNRNSAASARFSARRRGDVVCNQ